MANKNLATFSSLPQFLPSLMASSLLSRLLKRPSSASLPPLHSLSSLNGLHLSPFQSPCPNTSPSLPENLQKEPEFALSNRFFAAYPTFPHFSHLPPIYLINPDPVELKFEMGFSFDQIFAHSNLGVIPPSEMIEIDGDRDEEFVIRADSVKKKRKRKMNKHKLKKLRKRLRRKT
ncbi:hypothetical protein LUZ60_013523 [Juncus effusus]|nr:hypothetical protein LUZ60_013523 [Juncus effusus]